MGLFLAFFSDKPHQGYIIFDEEQFRDKGLNRKESSGGMEWLGVLKCIFRGRKSQIRSLMLSLSAEVGDSEHDFQTPECGHSIRKPSHTPQSPQGRRQHIARS